MGDMAVKPKRIDGVDLSHWQGNIDINWGAAKKAGVKFLFHKATEGASWKDDDYDRRRKQAKANGVVFGAYHFARPGKGDAAAEADHFVRVARLRAGDMKPVLDLEDRGGLNDADLAEWVRTFTHRVYRHLGFTGLILYTPFDLPRLPRGVRLWVARYNNQNEAPRVPKPFQDWAIHQFSNGKFGVPNSVPGIGHVDINTLHRWFPWARLKSLRIAQTVPSWPLPPKEPRKTVTQVAKEVIAGKWGDGATRVRRLKKAGYNPEKVQAKVNALLKPRTRTRDKDSAYLRIAHISMQFSDSDAQQMRDAEKVFRRGYDIITGTEAGPGAEGVAKALSAAARKYGYRLHNPSRYDTWVAVKRNLVVGDWETGQDFALWRSSRAPGDPPGRWGDKGVVWASWDMGPTFGRFAVGAVHYLTHKGAGEWKEGSDKKYAEVVDEWVSEKGKGSRLAFIGGDFNLNDRRRDVFFGHPLTTCWDDLKAFPNTGHGPIDAIARYDRDARVKCWSARVLDDADLPLHTDHFLVETVYEVQPLSKPKPDTGTSKAQEAAITEFRNQGHGQTGMCLKRVREAFDIAARDPSAIAAWNNTPEANRHRTRDPKDVPRGYPVFWEGGRFGHVAISLGNGRCLSTDILRPGFVDEVSIDFLSRKWGKRLIGWTDRLNGVKIND